MAWLPSPIACDVCGTEKQPSNHWWYADIGDTYFFLYSWHAEAENRERSYVHLCGQACAIRKLNEFMAAEPTTLQRALNSRLPQAEINSTQESAAQPQWTAGGPITEPE
jgi:hypothetical protein